MSLSLPVFSVGSKVRASDLAMITAALTTLAPLSAFKILDENINTGNTGATLHNDPALFLPLAANTTYWVDLSLEANAFDNTIDMKLAWTYPALTSIYLVAHGAHQNWANPPGTNLETEQASWRSTTSPSATIVYGLTSGTDFGLGVHGVVKTGANAGNLQLQTAQGVASANSLTVRSGAMLTARIMP